MNPFAAVTVPTFSEVIAAHAAGRSQAPALRFAGRSWSYSEMWAHSGRIANGLLAHGLKAGDRIAFLGRNSDAIPLLALATSRVAMIFLPINWRLSRREIEHVLADSGSSLVVSADGFDPPLPAGLQGRCSVIGESCVIDDAAWLPASEDVAAAPVSPSDTVLLVYTSGTTGLPKGVMLSHRSLFGTSTLRKSAAIAWDDWSSSDVTLVPIPLAHIAGFGMLARTLFFGGEVVIQPTFDPGEVLDAIEHRNVSKLGLVPTAIKMLIDHPRSRQIDYSRIKTMVYGAAPISLDLLREAIGVFGCEFAQSYGMSETSGTCVALPPEDHDVRGTRRMRSAGRPLPGTELKILGEDARPLPQGEIGEIAIRCISAMNGYWNMPEATAAAMDVEGWYRSGDAGYLDEDGYLFIKDRVKDMIVSGAENVYPAEVENALADHPDISMVAVIGIPHALWGEAVKAVVVPKAGHTVDPASVIAWAKERIADYKAPKTVDIVSELPLNASGKVQKAELRKLYWGDRDSQVS